MAPVPARGSWEPDIYTRDFVPDAFLAVNESAATVIPSQTVLNIDFGSYIATSAGSRFLEALPELPRPRYSGTISLQSTESIDLNSYARYFEDCLALEAEAHATTLEDYKLYGVNLELADGRNVPLFKLKLPGLGDGTPAINPGETVLLRQLILDQRTRLPRDMDAWLRSGGGRHLGTTAPGFTGLEISTTVYAVDKIDESILVQAQGLVLALPLICNVGFVLPSQSLQAMQRAVLNAAQDMQREKGSWIGQMLFPEERDGVKQTELPSVVFDLTWHDGILDYEQKV